MRQAREGSGWVEEIGVLREDGSCPITMSTMRGKDQVICINEDHSHCTGCYEAVRRGRIWCGESCRKMVNNYEREQMKGDPSYWRKSRRRRRTRAAITEATTTFVNCYGIAPTKLFVNDDVDGWLSSVKKYFPNLRVVKLPPGAPSVGYGVLFGIDREKRVCVGVCRLSTRKLEDYT